MNTKFAVLHQLWNINGGTYDAIEYAYVLSKLGTTNLIMYRLKDCVFGKNDNLESMKNDILDIIHKKYMLDKPDFNIIIRKGNIIDRNQYKSILAVDSVIVNKIPLFLFEKAFILADPYMSNISFYHRVKDLPNVYTYNEMPFFPAEVNYKFKFAFDIYKKYDRLENNTLISYKNDKEPFNKHITKFVNNITGKEVSYKWPINDFHQKFNKYVYNNIAYFDPRPRIFHECAFYGISTNNIIRNIKSENYDGAYYRIKSLQEDGLEYRYLTIEDELIRAMNE